MTISKQDLILLSSYLDGELPPGQKSRLEERLLEEEDLAEAFKALSRTRTVLRSAPSLKAPRNFTLTTAMVAEGKQSSWLDAFQALRLASAVAAVLLAAVLVLDFGPGLAPARLQEAAPPAVMEKAAPSEGDQVESQAMPSPQDEEEQETMLEAPAEEETAEDTVQKEEQAERPEQEGQLPEQPQEENGVFREQPPEDQPRAESPPGAPPVDWMLIAEIVLAVAAAGLAGGAYFARKQAR